MKIYEKLEVVMSKVRVMSKEEFDELLVEMDEKDIWEEMGNYYEDRMNVISEGFEEEDIERYYDKIN
jgi:hypothetical protein